ncbi:MAG: holin family protein [Ruminococcus sp.]|uniref:phage holin family protein n=1 Tax=Ruminococcus sp. TaxID=41978 RepID=UPI002E7958AE|nr:phage holin family protein [Ruminococcus sp.]MEE0836838.1 phage holin family protein [Ruminococcus sp.]
MTNIKTAVLAAIGTIGGGIAALFGGWTSAMTTLIIFMVIDYATGIIVAGVFHRSGKSKSGALESRAGFKGLCRKGMILLILLVACRLDIMLGTGYIKDCVCIAFVVNETLSIIENAGLMGVPIPQVLIKAIDVLKAKEEK